MVYRRAWGSARGRETCGAYVVTPLLLSNVIEHYHLSTCHQRGADASSMLVAYHRPDLCWEHCLGNFTLLRAQHSFVLHITTTPVIQERMLLSPAHGSFSLNLWKCVLSYNIFTIIGYSCNSMQNTTNQSSGHLLFKQTAISWCMWKITSNTKPATKN